MGQSECLKLLEKNNDVWYTSKQVAEKLKLSVGCTTTSMSKLYRSGFVQRKIERGNNYFYKSK